MTNCKVWVLNLRIEYYRVATGEYLVAESRDNDGISTNGKLTIHNLIDHVKNNK